MDQSISKCFLLMLGVFLPNCNSSALSATTSRHATQSYIASIEFTISPSIFEDSPFPPIAPFDEAYLSVYETPDPIPAGWRIGSSGDQDTALSESYGYPLVYMPVVLYPGRVVSVLRSVNLPNFECAIVTVFPGHRLDDETLLPSAVTSTCVSVPPEYAEVGADRARAFLPDSPALGAPIRLTIDSQASRQSLQVWTGPLLTAIRSSQDDGQ